jgi:hypothetical protein
LSRLGHASRVLAPRLLPTGASSGLLADFRHHD